MSTREIESRPDSSVPPGADVRPAVCTLSVDGLDCGSCAESVSRSLRSLDGVEDVRADVVGGRVTVTYDHRRLGRDDLAGRIRDTGYAVRDEAAARTVFEVEGLCCATEARQIEERLASRPGVTRLAVDVVGRRVAVEGSLTAAEVEREIARLGMRARRVGVEAAPAPWWDRRGRLAMAVLAGVLWAGYLAADALLGSEGVAAGLAVGAMVAGGWYIVPRGLKAARNRSLDMNFLMTIAAIGALFIGEHGEAASAMFLFAVAQLLESYSMDRARNAIRGLMDLSPTVASVLRSGREERVSAAEVRVGETVRVRPGEKIAVDGEVLAGRTRVDQAPITGESIPVDKGPGDEVFAGTLNGDGALEVRSTRAPEDTTLARIIHAVEEAQATRAPSQAFVDRFARVYTPAVVAAGLLLAVVPPLLGAGDWGTWLYRALVLLVVACPCALVISTPVTIVSALAGAARRGILVKGGLHLENAGRACVVALDKTGTLTEGQPAVVEVLPFRGTDPIRLLTVAAAAEAHSEHPLARAIVRHAAERGLAVPAAADVTAVPGKGVRARVGGDQVLVGSERFFEEMGALGGGAREVLLRHEGEGRTAVLVGSAGRPGEPPTLLGALALSDRLRPEAADALRALHAAGIRRVVMLTGDNPGTARAVAAALGGAGAGLDEFRAGLLPQDKVDAVRELRRSHGAVVFVGDGVNDAPALATADVGVAMGSAGTDVALETADIALMSDDLSQLPVTLRLARRAEGIIRANIALSLLTKAAFIALAVTGHATLWMAVAADMGTSLLVILNGLRALRV